MHPDGKIVFVLSAVCLLVCLLSSLTSATTFEPYEIKDFIFSIHVKLMLPFQMIPRPMTLTVTFMLEIAFSDLNVVGA